jgi:hypothetical protein
MRRLWVVVASMVVGLLAASAAPAPATAATTVTIHRISVPAVSPGAKATVRPNVSKVGPVKITKRYFSIYQTSTGKSIVKSKKSAKLAAGTYQVKTTVKYKIKKRSGGYTATKKKTRWQRLVVTTSTGTCATPADAARLRPGDSKATVAGTLHSAGRLDWSTTTGGIVHEDWRYTLCGSAVQWVWVTYENNQVTDSWVE